MVRPAPLRAPALVALVVLVGLAAAATCWRARSAAKHSAVCMDGCDVHDLAAYLEGRGLRLHISPSWAGGNARTNAYLSTTAKPGAELYGLAKNRRKMHPWAGVVYCERVRYQEVREGVAEWREDELQSWSDCGLRVGPFVFFGDPALLARIRTALGAESASKRAPATRAGRGQA
jgi:hypothetical protein